MVQRDIFKRFFTRRDLTDSIQSQEDDLQYKWEQHLHLKKKEQKRRKNTICSKCGNSTCTRQLDLVFKLQSNDSRQSSSVYIWQYMLGILSSRSLDGQLLGGPSMIRELLIIPFRNIHTGQCSFWVFLTNKGSFCWIGCEPIDEPIDELTEGQANSWSGIQASFNYFSLCKFYTKVIGVFKLTFNYQPVALPASLPSNRSASLFVLHYPPLPAASHGR